MKPMPNTLSVCEWIFGGRPLRQIVDAVRAYGYEAIEIAGEPDRQDRAEIKDALDGLSVSGTTSMGRWPTQDRDLTHSDSDARRRAVHYYKGCVDLAAGIGAPTVGLVPTAAGRLEPLTDRQQEWALAVEGVREVAYYAGESGVQIGIEAINRYETHLVNRLDDALALADECGVPSVGVIPDAFHMQLEEADSASAIIRAEGRLLALHLADSTRLGLGHGSLDLAPILRAARECGFGGPLVMEFTAPGPNPFQPDKGPAAMSLLDTYLAESAARIRADNEEARSEIDQ